MYSPPITDHFGTGWWTPEINQSIDYKTNRSTYWKEDILFLVIRLLSFPRKGIFNFILRAFFYSLYFSYLCIKQDKADFRRPADVHSRLDLFHQSEGDRITDKGGSAHATFGGEGVPQNCRFRICYCWRLLHLADTFCLTLASLGYKCQIVPAET